MTGSLVAGVDCSTQATKVVLVDVDSGAIVAAGRGFHEVSGSGGARETDPRDWTSALERALAEALGGRDGGRSPGVRSGDVAALAVGGQQHGLVVLDAADRPLRPAVLWNDTRSAPDAEALVGDLGGADAWAARIGLVPVASFTVSKWAWLRRTEPAVADAAAAVRLPHDEVTARLTGRSVTDRGDASGTGWWSTAEEAYAKDVLGLERVRLDPALLPAVLAPREAAGEVTAAAAQRFGLVAGLPVGPGTGDNMAAALGLALAPGQAALSLGTSGTVYATSARRPADPSGIVAGFADATGRFLPLACTLNATLAVDRVARWLGLDREAVEDGGEVVVLPYLDGERTPNLPRAAGTITGLRHDTTPGQVLRAAYEGAVVSLLDALDLVGDQAGGLDPDAPLILIGGGAQGRAWRETVRRLSGRPLLVPDAQELVALGAAAQAAAVLTGERPEAVAARWGTTRGVLIDPLPRDEVTRARHTRIRAATAALNQG